MKLPLARIALPGAQTGLLLALSVAFAGLFIFLHLPAAILLGAMAAGLVVAARGAPLRIPQGAFVAAQGVVGCLIARSMKLDIAVEALHDWPVFVSAVLAVIFAAGGLGWVLMKRQVLPGTTAVWGLAPGAATAMTLLAEAYGADVPLVAFMQYLRVVLVTVVASLVSRLWLGVATPPPLPVDWFPLIGWNAGGTLGLALLGAMLARRWRIPAGALVLPMIFGVLLQSSGAMRIELPPALLAASYAVIGWSIGLRFTAPIIANAARALPQVLAAILGLIAICIGFAALLVHFVGVDPLTAYLATSPGGADSVALIAASSNVNVPFVMSMQMARFVAVLLVGPRLSQFIAQRGAAAKGGR
jgi:membrane AbrB-like protein